MSRVCSSIAGAALALAMTAGWCVRVGAQDVKLPLWPYPHEVELRDGLCDLSGKEVVIPSAAGEKARVIAEALAARLAADLSLPAPPKVRREGTFAVLPYVLSVGRGPDDWAKAIPSSLFDKVHPTLRDQAYCLDITPQGAVIVAPGSRGLWYGAVTLMQLVRNAAEGTKVRCAVIRDWPDLEVRAAHVTRLPIAHRELAGVYALETKVNMFVWENFMVGFAGDTHPELGVARGPSVAAPAPPYAAAIRRVRSLGIEVVPLRNMAVGHVKQSGLYPYAFLGEGETYYRAMKDVIDSELEAYTPRYFHLGLDEEQGSMQAYLFPVRTLKTWRDVAVELASHLRRRGVMPMMWSELLFPQWGGRSRYYNWKGEFGGAFPHGYDEFLATFPRDMILVAWYYWSKSPADTLDGPGDLRRQAGTGLPVLVGATGIGVPHHTAAVKMIKPERPNALGVLTTAWGGDTTFQDKLPRYPEYVRRAAGPFWNLDVQGTWPPEKTPGEDPFFGQPLAGRFKWPSADLRMPDLSPLLDADPVEQVDDALRRLADADWRTWTHAREELVAAGLPVAPALLAAMSKAQGELRDRIEGCLSRNARDSRHGRKRGTLDAAKVVPFLRDASDVVSDMAAELLASCVDRGEEELVKHLRDPQAAASCIRALGIVRNRAHVAEITAALGRPDLPPRAHAEAARALGILRVKEAAGALRAALRPSKDSDVRHEAVWALALIGCVEADEQIAELLDSDDRDTRFRAAIALTILASPETKQLVPWLLKDRHSLELAAWAMWKTWKPQEAETVLREASEKHDDETCRKRLQSLADIVVGKGEAGARY